MQFKPGAEAFRRLLKILTKSVYLNEAAGNCFLIEGDGGNPSSVASGTSYSLSDVTEALCWSSKIPSVCRLVLHLGSRMSFPALYGFLLNASLACLNRHLDFRLLSDWRIDLILDLTWASSWVRPDFCSKSVPKKCDTIWRYIACSQILFCPFYLLLQPLLELGSKSTSLSSGFSDVIKAARYDLLIRCLIS